MRREYPKTVDGDYLDYIRSLGVSYTFRSEKTATSRTA